MRNTRFRFHFFAFSASWREKNGFHARPAKSAKGWEGWQTSRPEDPGLKERDQGHLQK